MWRFGVAKALCFWGLGGKVVRVTAVLTLLRGMAFMPV
jgi:hypothetical protein